MLTRFSNLIITTSLTLFSATAQAEKQLSADEAAKELANPNTALASLNFKFQYRTFEGNLAGASNQNSSLVLFQPSLPFPLDNGDKIIFRPAVPLIASQPAPLGAGQYDDESGIGDIAFDLAYAPKRDDGLLVAYGFISSLPTATEDSLGSDRVTLGPELLIGKITQDYVLGAFPNHQWDVAGSGDKKINLTTMQVFASILPGGGWNYGSSPIMSYDWETEESTIPVNFNFGKTLMFNGSPWKLSLEINYYVAQPDAFGPEWMIGFTVTPVVKNKMVSWFK